MFGMCSKMSCRTFHAATWFRTRIYMSLQLAYWKLHLLRWLIARIRAPRLRSLDQRIQVSAGQPLVYSSDVPDECASPLTSRRPGAGLVRGLSEPKRGFNEYRLRNAIINFQHKLVWNSVDPWVGSTLQINQRMCIPKHFSWTVLSIRHIVGRFFSRYVSQRGGQKCNRSGP